MRTHEGRIALVTGAAQGIGQAIALALAERGAQVITTDLKLPQETLDKIGSAARGFQLDVTVVVEGTSHGKMSGKMWEGGKTPGGRFCNVFGFRDDRISSLHIYLDPDYTGEDGARFRWGKNRQW